MWTCLKITFQCSVVQVREGADTSLARPNSRSRRAESIVSLERGVCLCAELQVFSSYRSWRRHVRRRARFQQHRDARYQVFFYLQGTEGNSRHSGSNIRGTWTIVCQRHNWVVQFKHGDLSTCDAPRSGRPKTVPTPEIIDKIHELIL